MPFPGFHTDMHPQMVALLSVADGTSVITENLYDVPFPLRRRAGPHGRRHHHRGQHAVDPRRGRTLRVARCWRRDISAGAALVLAGLRAEGTTVVTDAEHIDRGYEDFTGRLTALGATIEHD